MYDDFNSTPHRSPFFITDAGDVARKYDSLESAIEAFSVGAGWVCVNDSTGTVWFEDEPLDKEADFEGMEVLSARLADRNAEERAMNTMFEEAEARYEATFGEDWRDLLLND